MDFQSAAQVAGTMTGTVLFPIVMCIMLFSYMKEQMELHKKETDSLKDAINELKLVIASLTDTIKGGMDK